MPKKNKIIVSIVGITIVLLALLGITYAYYLTRIEGNTNTNSISLTTANLLLKYDDGSGAIVEENIMPGVTFEKTFSLTNEGNATIDNYVVYLEDVINDLTRTEDLTYTLTCDNCAGSSGEYPKLSTIIATNSIEVGETHNYTLKVTYENLTDTDQSIDMGSTINGYIQIYNLTDIVDVTGNVINATDGDYVQINSEPKISQIVDGKYMLAGVEPGSHTITVRYKDTNGEEQIRSTKDIVIQKGNETKVEGNTITVTNDSQTVTIDVDATDENNYQISNIIKEYNPFNEGTLAYSIFKNAKNNKNGTQFVNVPLTTPAEQISSVTTYKTNGEEATFVKSMSSMSSYTSETWYYYDTYEVDTTTGKFTLSGKQSCTYSSCYSNLVGKYLYANYASGNSNANNHTATTKTNLLNIYKVITATSSSLKYVQVFSSPNDAERVLVPTTDDYGTSYYYRGDVEDNYVNFAGMCWRIVHIEGDGSIKLILEDMYTECNNPSFTGNWSDGKIYVFGYDDSTDSSRLNFLNYEGGLADSFKTFQTKLAKKMDSSIGDTPTNEQINNTLTTKLKSGDWCLADKAYIQSGSSPNYTYTLLEEYNYSSNMYYDSYVRLYGNSTKEPTLKCGGTKLTKYKDGTNMYVGTLTADEMSFAGAYSSVNYNYYLMNNYSRFGSEGKNFWSLSPRSYYFAFYLSEGGDLEFNFFDSTNTSRPAVSLKSGSVISSGEGTLEKPYIIG